jgi:rhodanese-related sulfurtransferase
MIVMKNITMQDLAARAKNLQAGEIILDVRSAEEFAAGHVSGAINIPHDQVGAAVERLRAYKTVYIHCHAGGRAGHAASQLAQLGLTNLICISGGGMGDWVAAGLPTVQGAK